MQETWVQFLGWEDPQKGEWLPTPIFLQGEFHGQRSLGTVVHGACNAGEAGLIPELGRSPGEGNGYPLQYSYLENPMDRGAWWATVDGFTKSWTQLSN